ncbi:hypothetical protein HYX10_01640 [Candidatus Woesearchaeota archaeon]|nr:hypothetical protein [Candidatus Woesearchaeota archaeon]
MAEIKVILWDIGGVIQRDDAMPAKKLGLTPAQYSRLTKTETFSNYLRGQTGLDSVARSMASQLDWEGEGKLRQVKNAILSNWEPPRKSVVSLIRRIKPEFRKMILSNCSYDWEAKVREAHEKEYAEEQRYLQLFKEGDIISRTEWE